MSQTPFIKTTNETNPTNERLYEVSTMCASMTIRAVVAMVSINEHTCTNKGITEYYSCIPLILGLRESHRDILDLFLVDVDGAPHSPSSPPLLSSSE